MRVSLVSLVLALAAPVAAAPGARVFVSNEDTGEVAIIDSATDAVTTTVAVGKRPRGLRVSRDGKTLFVALSGSPKAGPGVDESKLPPPDRTADGIGMVDLGKMKLTRTLKSGQDPESFDLSADGKMLFVSNEETKEASVLDVAAGKVVRRIPVGEEPEGVALHPNGKVVYVTCEADNKVAVVDVGKRKVIASFETGPRPRAIAFTPDGARAFVTSENGGIVNVVDARTHKVTGEIKMPSTKGEPMPPRPMGMTVSPDGKRLFVSNGRAGSVVVVDTATTQVVKTYAGVGARPWGVGVTPDGRKLYTANGPSGDVSVIDVESGQVLKKIKLGGAPWGIAVAGD